MGLLQRMGLAPASRVKSDPQKLETYFSRVLTQWLGVGVATWPEDNPESYIEKGFNYNGDVYSIVSYIAEKGAEAFNVKLFKGDGERVMKHPVLDLLWQPNQVQGKKEFLEQYIGYRLTTGNGYIYGPKIESGPRTGQTDELFVLPAQHITAYSGGSAFDPIKGYSLTYNPGVMMLSNDVLHSRKINLLFEDGQWMYGMSPLRAGLRTLERSNSNNTARVRAYQNGGVSGILTKESETGDFNEDQALDIKREFLRRSGAENYKSPIITSGMVKWQQIGLSPVDLELLDDAKLTMRDLCRLYKVDPKVLGDSEASTYNNMGEARKAAFTDAIIPELQDFVDHLNRWLVPAYGDDLYLELDISKIPEMQSDKAETVKWLGEAWWIKGSRKQEIMGEEPDPVLDDYYIPAQYIPIGDMNYVQPDVQTDVQKYLDKWGIQDYK